MKKDKSKDFFRGFFMGACIVGAVAIIMLVTFWIFL